MTHPSKRQQGTVAVIVAIAMASFIGFTALALDLGKVFIVKSELQNAADSCALAAATELDGGNDALVRAQGAAKTVLAKHRVLFQKESIPESALSLSFSDGNNIVGASAKDAKQANCTLTKTNLGMWFAKTLGFNSETVSATAIAGLSPSQANCVIPVGICTKGSAPNFGLTAGEWLDLPPFGASKWRWVDFSPPAGGTSELNAWLDGPGACEVSIGRPVSQPGEHNGVSKGWNHRFGIYSKGQDSASDVLKAPPDKTGKAYTNPATQKPALPDFLAARSSATPYSDSQTGYNLTKSQSVTTFYGTYGGNRRLAIAPIVDCAQMDNHTATIIGFGCILMLNPMDNNNTLLLEYQGEATASPCVAHGMPGGSSGLGGRTVTLHQ